MSGKLLDFEARRINDSAEARGKEIDKEIGKEIGVGLMAKLAVLLIQDGRVDDITRAGTDEDFRNKLFNEYQLA